MEGEKQKHSQESRASKGQDGRMYANYSLCSTENSPLWGYCPVSNHQKVRVQQGKGIADHYWPQTVFFFLFLFNMKLVSFHPGPCIYVYRSFDVNHLL